MTNAQLKKLLSLLAQFRALIAKEQPLAAQVISLIFKWADDELDRT